MPSPEVLDFAKLLAPINGDKPGGADLRADSSPASPYYAIKDARNTARTAERQRAMGEDNGAPPPDWRPVLQHATKALAEKAKDLEVTAYLIEALVRLHGFAGLRDGFRLARELSEKYWDQLYPMPDEEGILTRVAPLTGLNGDDAEGTLLAPITRVPLTENTSVGRLDFTHYQGAVALGGVTDAKVREKKIAQGAVAMDVLQKAVAESSSAFFNLLLQDLTQSIDEFTKLGAVLDQKCGPNAPPSSAIRTALVTYSDTLKDLARNKLISPTKDAPGGPAAGAEAGDAAPSGKQAGGPLRTREDAFRTLLEVADFFRRTEPHTPISYALEQAVRWGQMSLPELLSELIPDEAPRKNLFKQVGIRPEPSKSDSSKK
jgi:type VI secretion system protein ImpA